MEVVSLDEISLLLLIRPTHLDIMKINMVGKPLVANRRDFSIVI